MSKRPVFYFSPGASDRDPGENITHVVLTLDPDEALRLALRLLKSATDAGGDVVQIDLPVGRGEWFDPRVGFGGEALPFPKLKRCPGSGQPLVAVNADRPDRVSECPVCRSEIGDPWTAPAGTLAAEHKVRKIDGRKG